MSAEEVSGFITKLLCRNRGCLEYEGVNQAVQQRYRLSDRALSDILSDSSRFIITGGAQPSADSKVIAKTPVRLCQDLQNTCDECHKLHLCRYLVCGHCKHGESCKYPHGFHSSHNQNILTEEGLQDLEREELFLLLLQNDNYLLPDICSHYNTGSGKQGSCTYKEKCFNLHICKFFLQGDCIYGKQCRHTHKFDKRSIMILKGRGLGKYLFSEHPLYEIYKNRLLITAALEETAQGWLSESSSSSSSSTMKVIEANSSEICLYFILGQCRYREKCKNVHYDLPYRWQILNSDGVTWNDHPNMEDVERAYSSPENDVSKGLPAVNFLTMKCGSAVVRRLSTLSSVTKHSSHLFTTEWLWYWKDSEGQWNQYGCEEGGKSEASSSSHTLEKNYLWNINGRICISIDREEFIINFKDMCQQNHNQANTEVRRRPRFVSASEIKIKQSRKEPGEQHKKNRTPQAGRGGKI